MSLFYSDDDSDDDNLLTDYHDDNLRRFMEASATDSDLDFAYNLQLQEAINASLSIQQPPPSTSSSSSSNSAAGPSYTAGEAYGSSSTSISHPIEQLTFRFGGLNVSPSHLNIFEDEEPTHKVGKISVVNYGHDEVEFGQGIFRNVKSEIFGVFSKGLIEIREEHRNGKHVLCGIGVSICDSKGVSIFDISKPLHDNSICKQGAEVKALIEGLNTASAFGIQKLVFYFDYHPIYQYATGKWTPRHRKVETLMSQLLQLRNKFTYCVPSLVSSNDNQLACKIAREAIEAQKITPLESCVICVESININQIFSVDVCKHRYCYSCMKKHVEVKLWSGMLPKCPYDGCKSELKVDSCRKFLTPALIELMTQRLKEAAIPVTERLYCPYPKCSALMSKKEVLLWKGISPIRSCKKCNGQFCIACNVPWHARMTCFEYKMKYPNPPPSERWLRFLAQTQSWRQCVKCQHMIELAEGCYHMTCRCGYEFCYTCGAEYKEKKATCVCPSWDEDFILASDEEREDEGDDDEGDVIW